MLRLCAVVALLVFSASATDEHTPTNKKLAEYLVIEMQTAHNPSDKSLFKQIDLFANLGLVETADAVEDNIGDMYQMLLPYSFTNEPVDDFISAGLPKSYDDAYANDHSINQEATKFINHGRAHAFMVRNYPRCFAKGGVIFDVPMNEASSRPLHLTDLIGFLTYKNSDVDQVFENTGAPQGNPPYEYVKNHFPKAFKYIATYPQFETRVEAKDFYKFTAELKEFYTKPDHECNGGPRTPGGGDGDGDLVANDNDDVATSSSSGNMTGAIVGSALGGTFVGFIVAFVVIKSKRARGFQQFA